MTKHYEKKDCMCTGIGFLHNLGTEEYQFSFPDKQFFNDIYPVMVASQSGFDLRF